MIAWLAIVFGMRQFLIGLVAVAWLGSAVAAQKWDSPVRLYEHRLFELRFMDRLFAAPRDGERCIQFSSYDRISDQGPAAGDAFYANHDRGNYLRVVERNGEQEHVMVDVKGIGCLARLWSANPSGTLHFDVDGKRVWSVDFAELCQGKVPGVPSALASMRARGGNIYLPVGFKKHLVVSASEPDLYYCADVSLLGEFSGVTSFTPELLADKAVVNAIEDLAKPYPNLHNKHYVANASGVIEIGAKRIVTAIKIQVGKGLERADLAMQLQRARLLVHVGKEVTVDVPVPAFFASRDWRAWQSDQLGVTVEGLGYCRWHMPFMQAGDVSLVLDAPLDGVELTLSVTHEEMENWIDRPQDRTWYYALQFRANYHQVLAQPTRPFSDHVVLNAKGTGRFVGCSLLVRNPSRIWWGEGDEKFYVDGETSPSWFGTGTEDYFGYAWCDPTVFSAPLHAQIQCDGPMNFGFTQLFRSHVHDNVPFQKSFRFDLERWHWVKDIKMDYATVAYWYAKPGATSGLPPLPPAAQRHLEPLQLPKTLEVHNALEGESLQVTSCTGGTHEAQNLSFFEGVFSQDAQRWWRDGKVGDVLTLAVPVAETGRYQVTLAMTRADDFANVQVSLAGTKLGKLFSGYAALVSSSGPFDAGTAELTKGSNELRFELVGKHPKAKKRMMVGLDYLILEKL